MINKKLIFPSLATLLLFNGALIADETTEATIESHASVRSREMDPVKREKMQAQRAEQAENQEAQEASDTTELPVQKANNKLTSSQSQFMFAPTLMTPRQMTLAAYAFPINCHWLVSISDTGRSLEIEDGSHWEISPADMYVLRKWRREDNIVISANYSWLSSYDYYITNKSTNTYVHGNLIVGPLTHGPYSHWIVDIDHFGGHVFLENQMIWCVNPQDREYLKEWAVNDHIIFGRNDGWFTPYDHILINVAMDNCVRVKQY